MFISLKSVTCFDSFLDAVIFSIDYIGIDSGFLLGKNGNIFGAEVSKIPLINSQILLHLGSESQKEIDMALSRCNFDGIVFSEGLNNKLSKHYNEEYKCWLNFADGSTKESEYEHLDGIFFNTISEYKKHHRKEIKSCVSISNNNEFLQLDGIKNCGVNILYDKSIGSVSNTVSFYTDGNIKLAA